MERDVGISRRMLGVGMALVGILIIAGIVVALMLRRHAAPPAPVPVRYPTFVTTLAGGGAPGLLEGRGIAAAFDDPFGVAVDAAGATYVADGGDNNVIWRVDPNGVARIVAGGREGFADGEGRAASFNTPSGVALDSAGNLVVADTGNHAIRRVTPAGVVVTLAGNGEAGNADGAARDARFNGPVGVAVAPDGAIIVADTYNDRIRRIGVDGQVTTIAGGSSAGYRDGLSGDATFDTPAGVTVDAAGVIYVADTGNDAVRRIGRDGQVTTIGVGPATIGGVLQQVQLLHPVGVAVAAPVSTSAAGANGPVVFVTDAAGRVVVLSASGEAHVLAGDQASLDEPGGELQRLRTPTGIAMAPDGTLRVADSGNYLVRRIARPGDAVRLDDVSLTPRPWLTTRTLRIDMLPWPVEPQREWHEVAATLGEARGSVGGDGRERLHTGIDVEAPVGTIVRAVRDEKVVRVLGASGFGSLTEALRIGVVSYVHVRVGRTAARRPIDADRLPIVNDEMGKPARVRVRRGTRFHVGDALGSVNPFAHVHLGVGSPGAEINVLALGLPSFTDTVPPTIASIECYSQAGDLLGRWPAARAAARRGGRIARTPTAGITVAGRVSIVVDAFDRVDGNRANRKLGVYGLGYQVLRADGTPAPGFDQPQMTITFDRLPAAPGAPELIYAQGSGITVYGNKTTRFRYVVTNHLQAGEVWPGAWDTSQLPPGTYVLRVIVGDFSGNTATRDVPVLVTGATRP